MGRYCLLTLIALFVLSLIPSPVQAAKKRTKSASLVPVPKSVTTGNPSYSSARLSRATNSVMVHFYPNQTVSSITYALSYTADSIPQGVVGSVTPSGNAIESRDLYLGTCSKGVCTAHYSITNAALTVETNLVGGGVHRKRYRIRW